MKILVTFALETEFAPWRGARKFNRRDSDSYTAEIAGAEVRVALLGVGPGNAANRVSELFRTIPGMHMCICSGVAGALKPNYEIGQVLAAKTVRSDPPDDTGRGAILESSAALLSFASDCGATMVDAFFTAPRVIGASGEKQYLGTIADAVDMESFGILEQSANAGVPAIALRAVSDLSTEDLGLDFNEILTADGKVSLARMTAQLVRHPRALPRLINLGRHTAAAARSLARFLDRYIEMIASRAQNIRGRAVA